MRTQNEILKEMMTSSWVTGLDALQQAHCFRLPARVLELKAKGAQIEDRWQELPNGKRVKAYRLTKNESH